MACASEGCAEYRARKKSLRFAKRAFLALMLVLLSSVEF